MNRQFRAPPRLSRSGARFFYALRANLLPAVHPYCYSGYIMFVTTIEQLGLTEKESKVYMTSLRIGPAPMQVLARKAKIDRGTAYHVAQTLTEKGLFEMVQNGAKPLFRVTNPDNLYAYVKNRKEEAERQFAAVETMIDDLKQLYEVGA